MRCGSLLRPILMAAYIWQAVVHGVGFFVFSTVLDVRFLPAEMLNLERFRSNIFGVNAPHAVTHGHRTLFPLCLARSCLGASRIA